jgi:DNA mismatch endonuclease Vsr
MSSPVTLGVGVAWLLAISERHRMTKTSRPRAPEPLNTTVSAQMQRMPRSSTGPEMLIRRELHNRGLRFRVNYPGLPGRPDIAFTAARIAVFVDGCFWRSCPDDSVLPKNNRDGGKANLGATSNVIARKTVSLKHWAGRWCMCGSTRSRSKQPMQLSSCGVPYVIGVASKLGRLTCEILGDVHNGVGR